ncbi:tetratricopeptide repeat protein [Marinifilum sp.]|uniref:tetratricopeptide repeat protein n=1 Tax=Marinifilum sp. TaxID=2033137 RepID=UPI003BABEADD
MQKLLLFILLIPSGLQLLGQNNEYVDKKLDSIQNVHDQIKFLNDWTGKNYRSLPESTLFYSEKCLDLSKSNNDYSGAGNALVRIALIHKRKEDYSQALNLYEEAIAYYSLSKDTLGINKTYLNRGSIYLKLTKYDLALNDYISSLQYFEKVENQKQTLSAYNNIGLVYKNLKDLKKALTYYKKALQIALKPKYNSYLYYCYNNIGNILSIQNDFQQAITFYKKNIDFLKNTPNKYRLAQTYHNIGACFLEMEQYALAIDYQQQSLKLKEEIGNKNLIITSLNGLSHANYMMNNFEESLKYSEKALRLGQEIGNIKFQENSTKEISKILMQQLKPDSALIYLAKYERLSDSILNIETLKQVSEIQAKYEAEKKEAHIELLKKENKSKVTQRNGLIFILFLIAGYGGFIVYSYYRNKKVTKLLSLQKARIERSKELLDYRNKELKISNQTKNKLFQIISHDLRSPLASVSGISDLIQILLKQGRYEELNETSQDLNECVTRVLNLTDNLLSWSLNQSEKLPFTPVVIPVKNLLISIIEIYKRGALEKNILLELDLKQNLFVYADKPMLETVVRNLLNNAIKFTPAGGLILLGAQMLEQHTEIWIQDNGVGIPESAIEHIFELDETSEGTRGEKGNGLGLILCKDFIERNHGAIWVESKEGKGTTFKFTVPNAENIYIKESIAHQ